MKQSVGIIMVCRSSQLRAKFYPTFFCKAKLHKQTTLLGENFGADFDVTERLLIKILCILLML
jgi:hypothetical protein